MLADSRNESTEIILVLNLFLVNLFQFSFIIIIILHLKTSLSSMLSPPPTFAPGYTTKPLATLYKIPLVEKQPSATVIHTRY